MTKLGPEARGLVNAGRGALRPNADDKARVLASLRARLGTSPAVRDDAPPAARPRVSATRWGTLSALTAGAVVVGALGFHWLGGGEAPVTPPSRVPATPSAAAPPASPPVDSPSSADTAPDSTPSGAPTPSLASPSAEASAPRRASDRLGEEVSILSRAEADLHSGHYASALRLLDEHQRKFPSGKLSQERVAAKIQALCALGRSADADAELARLSPDSVHEGRARAACSKAPSPSKNAP